MSTTTELPDYSSPFGKNSPPMFINKPSVSNSQYQHYNTNGGTEYTNLTPLMTTTNLNYINPSRNGDSSNPSSTHSSRTRLANIANDDSGISNSSSIYGGHHISYGSPQMEIKNEDDLDPIPRDRCNTWPMRRPNLDINSQTSPLIHDRIPEEETVYDSRDTLSRSGSISTCATQSANVNSAFSNDFSEVSVGSPDSPGDDSAINSKKSTTRRNAWGNMSYADLITQAILNSPEKRLTLSQVYEWMVQNVPYFRDKGDSNSSAGWKNSIRHNLSLHSRFMRIQNEGAGKSSWWVINPDAKPGRNPRRRAATMESSTKAALDKKRRGARKRVEMTTQMSSLHSTTSSAIGSTNSMLTTQRDIYNDQDDALNSNFDTFRGRTQSNLSVIGNSTRISPTLEQFDDFDFPPPPWSLSNQERSSNPEVNEIMGKTDQMRIDGGNEYRNGLPHMNGMVKMEVKTEPMMYQDVNGMIIRPQQNVNVLSTPNQMRNFGNMQQMSQQQQNHIIQQQPIRMNNMHPNNGGYYHQSMNQPPMYNNGGMMSQPQQNQQQWQNVDPFAQFSQQRQQSIFESQQTNGPLPLDLENLTLPDQGMLDLDLDAVIRHEMAHDQTMTFDGL